MITISGCRGLYAAWPYTHPRSTATAQSVSPCQRHISGWSLAGFRVYTTALTVRNPTHERLEV